MRKVAVTGLGMVTPLGTTAAETVSAWGRGESMRAAPLPSLSGTPLAGSPAAIPREFNAAERLGGRRMLKFMSDGAVLGCVAAREAVTQANARERFAPERIGLFAATGLAAADIEQVGALIENSVDEEGKFSCRLFGDKGLASTNPLLSFKILANMPACLVSIIEGIKGPNCIFTPWESQAGLALREAWLAVGEGEVDCAVAGGADSPAHASTYVYMRQAGWLGEDEAPANAGAYLVLERLETTLESGQKVLAVIEDVTVSMRSAEGGDPLAERVGRTFAAAPSIMAGLACHHADAPSSMAGADGWTVSIKLERMS